MLLTIPEVAKRLRVGRNQVYIRIRNGELSVMKAPNGRMRVTEEAVQDYISRHTVPARDNANEVA